MWATRVMQCKGLYFYKGWVGDLGKIREIDF